MQRVGEPDQLMCTRMKLKIGRLAYERCFRGCQQGELRYCSPIGLSGFY